MNRYRVRTILFLTLPLLFTLRPSPAIAGGTVYHNDFTLSPEAGCAPGVGAYWSTPTISFTPNGRYGAFLGEFGPQTVSLTLTNLPPHRTVTLSLNLFIMKSWDGSQVIDPVSGAAVGPDLWGCFVNGGPTLLSTSFSNINHFTGAGYPGITYPQAFPSNFPGGYFPPGTASAEVNTLGYSFAGVPMDAVYPLTFTFAHADATLTLNFVGSGRMQGIADESWGLDNVAVSLDGGTSTGPMPPPLEGAPPVYNPGNGHWYQAVRLPVRLSWAEARAAAERLTWQGLGGHLATITTPDEDRFITTVVLRPGGNDVWWLGGYQDKSASDYREPGGGWRWVTGEPWGYTRWHAATGEPNNRGGEDAPDLAEGWGGDWNDESAFYGLANFLVEYELLPPPPQPQRAPHAPTNLIAERVFATRVDLRWQDNSDNERAFAIWRRGGSSDWMRVGVVPPNTTTFTDTGLKRGTSYTYRVRATNQYASDWSNEVTVTTPAQ